MDARVSRMSGWLFLLIIIAGNNGYEYKTIRISRYIPSKTVQKILKRDYETPNI